MNVGAVVTEGALEYERARITVAISGGVVRAGVAALGQHVTNITVLARVSTGLEWPN